jgi:hypothetical protein
MIDDDDDGGKWTMMDQHGQTDDDDDNDDDNDVNKRRGHTPTHTRVASRRASRESSSYWCWPKIKTSSTRETCVCGPNARTAWCHDLIYKSNLSSWSSILLFFCAYWYIQISMASGCRAILIIVTFVYGCCEMAVGGCQN